MWDGVGGGVGAKGIDGTRDDGMGIVDDMIQMQNRQKMKDMFLQNESAGHLQTFLKDMVSNLAATSGGGRQFAVLLRPLRGLRAQQMPNKGKGAWYRLESQNSF